MSQLNRSAKMEAYIRFQAVGSDDPDRAARDLRSRKVGNAPLMRSRKILIGKDCSA